MNTFDKGLFIVFDGSEGVGKTTQIELLRKSFEVACYKVVTTVEPGGTNSGMKIRELLLDPAYPLLPRTESLLFSAARVQVVEEIIRPAIAECKVVICDRFAASTFAYQGYAGEVSEDNISWLTEFSAGGLWPDLLLIFDLEPEIGFIRKRGTGMDRIEQKSMEYHQKVRMGFLQFAKNHQDFCRVIDANCPIVELHENILMELEKCLGISLPAANM